jgi:hypothetical protein
MMLFLCSLIHTGNLFWEAAAEETVGLTMAYRKNKGVKTEKNNCINLNVGWFWRVV